jgi:hypothetical protein
MAEVADGGCYEQLPDGQIVRSEARDDGEADGGPGAVVGATSGELPASPKARDAASRKR